MNTDTESPPLTPSQVRALSLDALKRAAELVKAARPRFPKSMHNSEKFQLELTCATIGKAIHALEAE